MRKWSKDRDGRTDENREREEKRGKVGVEGGVCKNTEGAINRGKRGDSETLKENK